MPFGPGTYGPNGGGSATPVSALAPAEAMGMSAMDPSTVPSEEMLSELVRMLKGGQAGAERLLQLLSMLAQSTVPQMQQQGAPGGPPSIQGLLG